MRIYTKCPCCGKIIFLVMEMELGSNFGLTYKAEKSQDWHCLDRFLTCLQTSQGQKVYLGLNEKEASKLPKEDKELILKWKEGYKKTEEEKESKSENWRTHGQPFLDFNEALTQQWINQGFTKQQCHEWLNIGMKASDSDFCAWLRNVKQKTPEWVLNYGNMSVLVKEFEEDDLYS